MRPISARVSRTSVVTSAARGSSIARGNTLGFKSVDARRSRDRGFFEPRFFETDAAGIMKQGSANKRGLSAALDGTMKDGHDMKTFGLGTAASLADRARYARFTSALHAVYGAMEESLDGSSSPAVQKVWGPLGNALRRRALLAADLAEVGALPSTAAAVPQSAATRAYVEAIKSAAASDNKTGGGRLLGHVYCRYFADMFGGQMLATPTRHALGLAHVTQYDFDWSAFNASADRKEAVETLYETLNHAGDVMSPEARVDAVGEARLAFSLNVDVYKEDGSLALDAVRGCANVVGGAVRGLLSR